MKIISSKILLVLFLLFSIFVSFSSAQNNYIEIIIPDKSESVTTLSRHRLAANTLPNSIVKINGKKLRVYSSGSFVDLMQLAVGENIFEIESIHDGDDIIKGELIYGKQNTANQKLESYSYSCP